MQSFIFNTEEGSDKRMNFTPQEKLDDALKDLKQLDEIAMNLCKAINKALDEDTKNMHKISEALEAVTNYRIARAPKKSCQ